MDEETDRLILELVLTLAGDIRALRRDMHEVAAQSARIEAELAEWRRARSEPAG